MLNLLNKFQEFLKSINDISPRSPFLQKLSKLFVGDKDRVKLYRKLAKDMRYGMSIQDALIKQYNNYSRKSKHDFRAIMVLNIYDTIMQGKSLAVGFQNHAPVNDIMIIEAGERSGSLPNALDLTAEMVMTSKQMKRQILGAITMPSLMFVMLIVLFVIVGKVVIPTLAEVFPPQQWDGISRSLYVVSQFINSIWFIITIVSLISLIPIIIYSFPRWTGRIRSKFDKIPPWSFYRLLIGGGWLMSLASLVKSGESIVQSIKSMQRLSMSGRQKNKWLNERLSSASYHLMKGKNIGQALDLSEHNFPDGEIVNDLMSYAEQPNFDETLYQLGKEWVSEGLESFQTQSKILNSVAFFCMGITVSWFVLGLFQLYSQIGSSMNSGTMGGM